MINEYSPDRAKHQARYKRNRDHVNGTDAVKAAGEKYLPKASSTQTDAEFIRHKNRTHYFPAAARTADGLNGLVFRKAPKLDAPDSFLPFTEYVTQDALTLDDLAEKVFTETLVTNYTGLLVDHPEQPEGLSAAQALEGGYRPFISIYTAESILEASHSVIKNRKHLSYVRLLDDAQTVRELKLVDSVYTVVIHKLDNNTGIWNITETKQPVRNKQTMSEIPMVIVTDGKSKAQLDDMAAMNVTHYIHSADLALALYFVSAPIPVVTGVASDVDFSVEVGSVWTFENENTKANYLEFKGTGVGAIEKQLESIKQDMAAIGSRMLASEKSAAEAAETLSIRKASENSVLAAMTRTVSRKIEDALKWLAWWISVEELEINYSLNTDFLPMPMSYQEIATMMSTLQAGYISHETFYEALQAGEVVSENIDFEDEKDRIDSQLIDKPIIEK